MITSDPFKSPARSTLPLRAKGHSSLAGGLYFTWPERIVERDRPEPGIIPEMWNPQPLRHPPTNNGFLATIG